jgi:hypothetical protein
MQNVSNSSAVVKTKARAMVGSMLATGISSADVLGTIERRNDSGNGSGNGGAGAAAG